MEKFATLQAIIENYCISRKFVRNILSRYSINCYKEEDIIYIDFKRFHQIYTSKYNPALFVIEETAEETQKPDIKNALNRTFFNMFSKPMKCKQELRNLVMNYVE
jgi:hypothetical protein